MDARLDSWPPNMIHALRLAVCSLYRYNICEQSRSSIHSQPWKLGSVVVAQGTAYRCDGLCRQGNESGI
jgi:hypothetical protein